MNNAISEVLLDNVSNIDELSCDQEVSEINSKGKDIGRCVSSDAKARNSDTDEMRGKLLERQNSNMLNNMSSPTCQSCRELQQEHNNHQKKMEANLAILKEKIVTTDELIKNYQKKCQENVKLMKKVSDLSEKLKKCYGENGAMRIQLEKARQANEPLKKTARRFEVEKALADDQVIELTEKLRIAESKLSDLVSNTAAKDAKSSSLSKNVDQLLKENETLKEKLSNHQEEKEKLKHELRTSKASARKAEQRAKKAEKKHEDLNEKFNLFKEKCKNRREELEKESPKKRTRAKRTVKECNSAKSQRPLMNEETSKTDSIQPEIFLNDLDQTFDRTTDDETDTEVANFLQKYSKDIFPNVLSPSPPLSPIPPSPFPLPQQEESENMSPLPPETLEPDEDLGDDFIREELENISPLQPEAVKPKEDTGDDYSWANLSDDSLESDELEGTGGEMDIGLLCLPTPMELGGCLDRSSDTEQRPEDDSTKICKLSKRQSKSLDDLAKSTGISSANNKTSLSDDDGYKENKRNFHDETNYLGNLLDRKMCRKRLGDADILDSNSVKKCRDEAGSISDEVTQEMNVERGNITKKHDIVGSDKLDPQAVFSMKTSQTQQSNTELPSKPETERDVEMGNLTKNPDAIKTDIVGSDKLGPRADFSIETSQTQQSKFELTSKSETESEKAKVIEENEIENNSNPVIEPKVSLDKCINEIRESKSIKVAEEVKNQENISNDLSLINADTGVPNKANSVFITIQNQDSHALDEGLCVQDSKATDDNAVNEIAASKSTTSNETIDAEQKHSECSNSIEGENKENVTVDCLESGNDTTGSAKSERNVRDFDVQRLVEEENVSDVVSNNVYSVEGSDNDIFKETSCSKKPEDTVQCFEIGVKNITTEKTTCVTQTKTADTKRFLDKKREPTRVGSLFLATQKSQGVRKNDVKKKISKKTCSLTEQLKNARKTAAGLRNKARNSLLNDIKKQTSNCSSNDYEFHTNDFTSPVATPSWETRTNAFSGSLTYGETGRIYMPSVLAEAFSYSLGMDRSYCGSGAAESHSLLHPSHNNSGHQAMNDAMNDALMPRNAPQKYSMLEGRNDIATDALVKSSMALPTEISNCDLTVLAGDVSSETKLPGNQNRSAGEANSCGSNKDSHLNVVEFHVDNKLKSEAAGEKTSAPTNDADNDKSLQQSCESIVPCHNDSVISKSVFEDTNMDTDRPESDKTTSINKDSVNKDSVLTDEGPEYFDNDLPIPDKLCPVAAVIDSSPVAVIGSSPVAAVIDSSPVAAVIHSGPVAAVIGSIPVAAAIDSSPVAAVIDSSPVAAVIDSSPLAVVIDSGPDAAVIDSGPVATVIDSRPVAAVIDSSPDAAVIGSSPVTAGISSAPVAVAIDSSPVAAVIDSSPVAAIMDSSPVAAAIGSSPVAAVIDSSPDAAVIDSSPVAAVIDSRPVAAAIGSSPVAAVIDSNPDAALIDSESTGNVSSILASQEAEDTIGKTSASPSDNKQSSQVSGDVESIATNKAEPSGRTLELKSSGESCESNSQESGVLNSVDIGELNLSELSSCPKEQDFGNSGTNDSKETVDHKLHADNGNTGDSASDSATLTVDVELGNSHNPYTKIKNGSGTSGVISPVTDDSQQLSSNNATRYENAALLSSASRLRRPSTENIIDMFSISSLTVSPLPPSPPRQRVTPLLSPLPVTPQPEAISPLCSSPEILSPPTLRDNPSDCFSGKNVVAPKPIAAKPSNSIRALDFRLTESKVSFKTLPGRSKSLDVSDSIAVAARFSRINSAETKALPLGKGSFRRNSEKSAASAKGKPLKRSVPSCGNATMKGGEDVFNGEKGDICDSAKKRMKRSNKKGKTIEISEGRATAMNSKNIAKDRGTRSPTVGDGVERMHDGKSLEASKGVEKALKPNEKAISPFNSSKIAIQENFVTLSDRNVGQSELDYLKYCFQCLKNGANPSQVSSKLKVFKNLSSSTTVVSAIISHLKSNREDLIGSIFGRVNFNYSNSGVCNEERSQSPHVEDKYSRSPPIGANSSEIDRIVSDFKLKPGLSEMEDKILFIVLEIAKIQHLKAVYKMLLQLIPKAIFNEDAANTTGLQSLCRMYTALCRFKNKIEEIRGLMFDVAYSSILSVHLDSIVLSCFCLWPQIFQSNRLPGKRQNNQQSIESCPVSCTVQAIATWVAVKQERTHNAEVLEYIFGWSLVKENGLVSLCDTLLNMLEDSEQTEEKKMSSDKIQERKYEFEIVKSIEVLSVHMGWEWCNNYLIRERLWRIFGTWTKGISRCPSEQQVSETVVIRAIRLIGLVSRIGIRGGHHFETPDGFNMFLKACGGILQKSQVESKISLPVQIAAAHTLLNLSPANPNIAATLLKDWLKNKSNEEVPIEIRMAVESTAMQEFMESC